MAEISHSESKCITRQLLRQTWELIQVEIGIIRPIQDIPLEKVHTLITACWFKRLWKSFQEADMLMKQDVCSPPFLTRENDKYIIEEAIRCGRSGSSIEAINRCCLYLQLLTTSDVLTGSGKNVRSALWKGEKELHYGWDYTWPKLGTPSRRDWNDWRSFLIDLFSLCSGGREVSS